MKRLYVILFGSHDGGHFARAAYLRSAAAYYRDLCEYAWHGTTKEDWATINHILENAYKELQEGIQANKDSH